MTLFWLFLKKKIKNKFRNLKKKERKNSEKQDQIEKDDAHDVWLGELGDDLVRRLDDQFLDQLLPFPSCLFPRLHLTSTLKTSACVSSLSPLPKPPIILNPRLRTLCCSKAVERPSDPSGSLRCLPESPFLG